MARKVTLNPRPWHPGYPFRRPTSRSRRAISFLLLVVLVTLIAGYAVLTDSERVRRIAEHYLSEATGGEVTVGRGHLSVFEGLRLDDVTVRVPGAPTEEPPLFTAAMLYVRIPVADLVRRQFSKTTLIAVEPRVTLVSDPSGQSWNFQRLKRPNSATVRPDATATDAGGVVKVPRLPQMLLRGGRLEYVERSGATLVRRGGVVVDGHVTPDPLRPDHLTFAVSARGSRDRPGTSLTGSAFLLTGQVSARLQNFDLSDEFLTVLPGPVRRWWERHEISGNVEIPELTIDPIDPESLQRPFRVVAVFRGGAMSLLAEDLSPPSTAEAEDESAPDRGEPPPAVRVDDVRGRLVFTQRGIELQDMSLRLEGSRIEVSGRLDGYSPGSPLTVDVRCDELQLPENPAIVAILPRLPREIYATWRPSGLGRFAFRFERDADGRMSTDGRLDVLRGRIIFERFPYPVHDITGSLVVRSVSPGRTRLEAINLRGRGRGDGPNRDARLRIDGFMEPLEGGSEVDFRVSGENVVADDELVAAMPVGAREVLEQFDDTGRGFPHFGGSFTAEVYRAPGRVSRWRWPIDVHVEYGKGRYAPFPYPLDAVTGHVRIESGRVTLEQMQAITGPARLVVNGQVRLGDPRKGEPATDFDLDLTADGVPIDATLLACIDASKRPWVEDLGPAGTLLARGRIEGPKADYALRLSLRDGELQPRRREPAPPPSDQTPWRLQQVVAELELTPRGLRIVSASGRRGAGRVAVSGDIAWNVDAGAESTALLTLDIEADQLELETSLRDVLDDASRRAWDAVAPSGPADVKVRLSPNGPPSYRIRALGVAVQPSVLPVRVDDVRGEVAIDGEKVRLNGLTGRRGTAQLSLDGTGGTTPTSVWDVRLTARDLMVDRPLRSAMPALLRDALESLSLEGKAHLQLRRMRYVGRPAFTSPAGSTASPAGSTASPAGSTASPAGSTASPASDASAADVDFDVRVEPIELTASLGVPLRAVGGEVALQGDVRGGRLGRLTGSVQLPEGEVGGRAFRAVTLRVSKDADRDGMMFDELTGRLADGELSGFAALAFPPGEATRYGLDLSLRNADVAVLVGKLADTPVSGRMTASLTLEGAVANPASRRGRGDLSVTGERLARVPVLLGLVQIANLSLPLGTSFNNASARYNMDGPRITFEQLVLRSPGMQIDGAGFIDLDRRQVRLSLWSVAASDLPKVPIFSDLADRTRRELLQIHIRGSIDNPRIGASSFDSFTTTVDEVLRAGGGGGGGGRGEAGPGGSR